MNTSDEVAKILLDLKAVSLNPKKPFRYTTGILSPVYIDCRILISHPKERNIIRDLYIEEIKKIGLPDVIAGTATAGIPHAAWIAMQLNLPMIYIRGKAKEHGRQNQIEGVIKEGQKVFVIEDLVSTGESSINSVGAIRGLSGEVSYVFSIITYGMQKAQQNFKENKVELISLTNFEDVVHQAQKLGYINNEEINIILDWKKDPIFWGKKMGFE